MQERAGAGLGEPGIQGGGLRRLQRKGTDKPAESQNYALRFKNEGITHILLIGVSPIYFVQAAENQLYRPLYGLSSIYGLRAFLQTAASSTRLHGSQSVGWLPV